MRHFFRCHTNPNDVIAAADEFFPAIALKRTAQAARERTYAGELGTVEITVRMEGGHYTFVEAHTDQMGESRLDRNVKKFFVRLHKLTDPAHALDAAY